MFGMKTHESVRWHYRYAALSRENALKALMIIDSCSIEAAERVMRDYF